MLVDKVINTVLFQKISEHHIFNKSSPISSSHQMGQTSNSMNSTSKGTSDPTSLEESSSPPPWSDQVDDPSPPLGDTTLPQTQPEDNPAQWTVISRGRQGCRKKTEDSWSSYPQAYFKGVFGLVSWKKHRLGEAVRAVRDLNGADIYTQRNGCDMYFVRPPSKKMVIAKLRAQQWLALDGEAMQIEVDDRQQEEHTIVIPVLKEDDLVARIIYIMGDAMSISSIQQTYLSAEAKAKGKAALVFITVHDEKERTLVLGRARQYNSQVRLANEW